MAALRGRVLRFLKPVPLAPPRLGGRRWQSEGGEKTSNVPWCGRDTQVFGGAKREKLERKGLNRGNWKIRKNIRCRMLYWIFLCQHLTILRGSPSFSVQRYTLLYSYIRIVYHFYLSPVVNSVVAEPSSQFTQMTNLPVFAVPLSLRQLFCQSVCRKTSSKIPCFPIWRASCCTTSILTRQQNSPRLPGLTAAQ